MMIVIAVLAGLLFLSFLLIVKLVFNLKVFQRDLRIIQLEVAYRQQTQEFRRLREQRDGDD